MSDDERDDLPDFSGDSPEFIEKLRGYEWFEEQSMNRRWREMDRIKREQDRGEGKRV